MNSQQRDDPVTIYLSSLAKPFFDTVNSTLTKLLGNASAFCYGVLYSYHTYKYYMNLRYCKARQNWFESLS